MLYQIIKPADCHKRHRPAADAPAAVPNAKDSDQAPAATAPAAVLANAPAADRDLEAGFAPYVVCFLLICLRCPFFLKGWGIKGEISYMNTMHIIYDLEWSFFQCFVRYYHMHASNHDLHA